MKSAPVFFLLALSLASCFGPEQDCKSFHTGTFRFETQIGGIKKSTVFTRNDSLEIETFDGKTDTATVRWVNDCEYILRKRHPKNMAERKAVSIRILTTSKNSYTFDYGLVDSDVRQQGTVTKIN
jgi:hypothetical protein